MYIVAWRKPVMGIVLLVCLVSLAACSGSNAAATRPTESEGAGRLIAVGVVPGQLRFDQERISVKTGELITVRFTNNDPTMPHNFVLDEPRVAIPAQNTLVGLAGGEEGSATFAAPAPGTYQYYCSVPGHREAGMVGTLEVTP